MKKTHQVAIAATYSARLLPSALRLVNELVSEGFYLSDAIDKSLYVHRFVQYNDLIDAYKIQGSSNHES